MKKIHANQKIAASGGRRGEHHSMDSARRNQGPVQLSLSHIQLHNLLIAIEMVLNDVKLDPFVLVSKLLQTYYSGMEKVRFQDLRKFFQRFETYFVPGDVLAFLIEVENL